MKLKSSLYQVVSLLAVILLCLVSLRHNFVYAESGITVAPAYVKLSVSGLKLSDSGFVSVKNDFSVPVHIIAQLTDVDTQNGTLVPTSSGSIAKFVKIDIIDFTLQANQSINIRLSVQRAGIPQGGHYAALLLKRVAGQTTTKTQPISQLVSVGLFLVNEDGVQRSLTQSFGMPHGIVFSLPLRHDITVTNTGNIDTSVYGYVSVNRGNIVYGKQVYSDATTTLFPSKSASYKVTIGLERQLWPGKYTFVSSYRYDGQHEPVVIKSTFWYVPIWSIFLLTILLSVVTKKGRTWVFGLLKHKHLVTIITARKIKPAA